MRVISIICLLSLITACGGTPEPPEQVQRNSPPPDTTTPLSIPIEDPAVLDSAIWADQNTFFKRYYLIDRESRYWGLTLQEATEDQVACFSFGAYFGQFQKIESNRYQLEFFGEIIDRANLLITNDRLLLDFDNNDLRQNLEESGFPEFSVSSLCDTNFGDSREGDEPITRLSELDATYQVDATRDLGIDTFLWWIDDGLERFFDYIGDSDTRADDCYVDNTVDSVIIPIIDNRYLVVFENGPIQQRLFYRNGNNLISDIAGLGRFARPLSEISADTITANLCRSAESVDEFDTRISNIRDLSGLWDFSFTTEDGREDLVFVEIDESGTWRLRDPQNDGFDSGPRCSNVVENFAQTTSIGNDLFSHQFSNPFFTLILSGTVAIVQNDDQSLSLIGFNNSGSRTLRPTELSVDDLPLDCDSIDNPVPGNAEPVQGLSAIAGYWEVVSNEGTLVEGDILDFDESGYVDAYLLDSDDEGICFISEPDFVRYIHNQNGPITRVFRSALREDIEIFRLENQLFIVDANTQSVIDEYIESSAPGGLCDAAEPIPDGAPVENIMTLMGSWQRVTFDGSVEIFSIGEDLSTVTRILQDSTASIDQRCFYTLETDYVAINPIEGNTFALEYDDGYGERFDIFIDGDTLIFYEFYGVSEYIPSLLDEEAVATNCPNIDDIPPSAVPVTALDQITGLWDASIEALPGVFNTQFWLVSDSDATEISALAASDELPLCYLSLEPQAITLDDNTLEIQRDEDTTETFQAFLIDDTLLLANNSFTLEYQRSTQIEDDLLPACSDASEPVLDLQSVNGVVWGSSFAGGLEPSYVVVNTDGSIDRYDYRSDTIDGGENCFDIDADFERFVALGGSEYTFESASLGEINGFLGSSEIDMVFIGFTGNGLTAQFFERSFLSLEDLQPECTP